ncbi:GATA zinc finger domain-containing protein 1 [Anopheles gambiae]|uniref:GATA zinc finger domain-containing protein 1 n=1 Tax=Anopheles gambiae TaxID=7165 RepID=UPI001AAD1854|nr:GATA zinc finger domain-containing protein 1 [Anopheles gambiae]
MSPKVQRCSICGTLETARWYLLDRRSICSDCHDVQLNPPLDPREERSPEPENRPKQYEDLLEEDAPPARIDASAVQHSSERALLECPVTPKKVDIPQPSAEGQADLESGADGFVGMDEQEELHDSVPPVGMFSPRRLRRRVCPVTRVPARRGTKKNGRTTKSRRALTKKQPTKAPRETASTRTVTKVLQDNVWYQVGDIVSMLDTKDNTYYAQIRGLIVDAYNEKSAVLTWLLPSTVSPPPNEGFDPATYMAGPDEEAPRRLTYMHFVMNAPVNYFLDRNEPYPRPECYGPSNTTQCDNRNYVWATMGR